MKKSELKKLIKEVLEEVNAADNDATGISDTDDTGKFTRIDGGGNKRYINFFDKNHNPMKPIEILYVGSQFAIARVDEPGQDIVALFSEDDDNYFYKCAFSSAWLSDLEKVAKNANLLIKTNRRK